MRGLSQGKTPACQTKVNPEGGGIIEKDRTEAICNHPPNVLQLPEAEKSATSILDNDIVAKMNSSAEEEDELMQQIRLRVVVGYKPNGDAVVKRVGAYDELSLADKVIEAVVKSGRIKEFLSLSEVGALDAHTATQDPEPVRKETAFDEYANRWFRTYKSGLAKTTVVFYSSKISVLNRFFGNRAIESITPDDVQSLLSERAKTYKKKTVHDDWATLKELLDSAVYDGIIQQNPAKDKRIRNIAKNGEGTAALTREQMAQIQKEIPLLEDPNEKCLIALFAYTSMRREEALGLMWDCVDFDAHQIIIQQAVVYANGQTHVKSTKTAGSKRAFPMCKQLEEILRSCRQSGGYVISDAKGDPLTHSRYDSLWKSLTSHIELYGMSAINFRTTFATMAVASGVDVRTTQSLMGHTTPEMTLKIYTKQESSRLENAMNLVTGFVAG